MIFSLRNGQLTHEAALTAFGYIQVHISWSDIASNYRRPKRAEGGVSALLTTHTLF